MHVNKDHKNPFSEIERTSKVLDLIHSDAYDFTRKYVFFTFIDD